MKRATVIAAVVGLAASASGHAQNGQSIVESQCIACHAVAKPDKAGIDHLWERKGPDLHYAGSKFNQAWLESWLQNPARIRPAGELYTKHLKATDAEDAVDETTLQPHVKLSAADAKAAAERVLQESVQAAHEAQHVVVAEMQADADRQNGVGDERQEAADERDRRPDQPGGGPCCHDEDHHDQRTLDAAEDQQRNRGERDPRAADRKQEQHEETDAIAEADRTHVRPENAQDRRESEVLEQRRVQEAEAEAVDQIDRHESGGPHLGLPRAGLRGLEFVETPELVAVGHGEPEIPEEELDIAASEQDDGDRDQERRDAYLEGRGGQQRELEQEQRQHDVAQINRSGHRIVDRAHREVQHHHGEGYEAPGHDAVDFPGVIALAQHVKDDGRQPHDGADEEIVAFYELKLRGRREVRRQDRYEQVLEQQDEDGAGRRVGRRRNHDGAGDETLDGNGQEGVGRLQDRRKGDRCDGNEYCRQHVAGGQRSLGDTRVHWPGDRLHA